MIFAPEAGERPCQYLSLDGRPASASQPNRTPGGWWPIAYGPPGGDVHSPPGHLADVRLLDALALGAFMTCVAPSFFAPVFAVKMSRRYGSPDRRQSCTNFHTTPPQPNATVSPAGLRAVLDGVYGVEIAVTRSPSSAAPRRQRERVLRGRLTNSAYAPSTWLRT